MDRKNKKIAFTGIAIVIGFLFFTPLLFMPQGETLFNEQKCNTCHRFRGQGGAAGPDLTDVTKRRGSVWIIRQIRNPRSHNPDSRMPIYDHLNYFEIWVIISYLKSP